MMLDYAYILLIIFNVGFITACGGGVDDEYRRDDFPAEFIFGSGTSAYQVFISSYQF